MNLLKRLIHHAATAAMFKICSWFKITKPLSFISYNLFCLGVPESLRYSTLCMNFLRKSEEMSDFRVLGGGKSNQQRKVSILSADRSMGKLQLQGRCWTSVNKQDRGDLSPALMACPQVLSKAEHGVCGEAKEPHPHLWSILFMSITAYGKHWIMATVLVKFKQLLWNAAAALKGGAHGMLNKEVFSHCGLQGLCWAFLVWSGKKRASLHIHSHQCQMELKLQQRLCWQSDIQPCFGVRTIQTGGSGMASTWNH